MDVLLARTLEAAVMAGEQFALLVCSQLVNLQLVDCVQQLTAVITLHARYATAPTRTNTVQCTCSSGKSLWLPCIADADIILSSCGFFLLLLSSFFPRLISAIIQKNIALARTHN